MFKTKFGERIRVSIEFPKETLTQQHLKDACDVNNILKRYKKTGVLEHLAHSKGQYGDFTAEDYHTSCNIVLEAEERFNELPARIRERFANDPYQFLAFVQDSNNVDEMYELGFLKEKPVKKKVEEKAKPTSKKVAADEPETMVL